MTTEERREKERQRRGGGSRNHENVAEQTYLFSVMGGRGGRGVRVRVRGRTIPRLGGVAAAAARRRFFCCPPGSASWRRRQRGGVPSAVPPARRRDGSGGGGDAAFPLPSPRLDGVAAAAERLLRRRGREGALRCLRLWRVGPSPGGGPLATRDGIGSGVGVAGRRRSGESEHFFVL